MPSIQNINRLKRTLEQRAKRYQSGGTPSVVVGYTANYAVYVHERPARHAPGKQAKFLEQPAREAGGILSKMIVRSLRNEDSLLEALVLAGMRLQNLSEKIVPVDTGNLRGGVFTAREDELEAVAAEARTRGELVRTKTITHRKKVEAKSKRLKAWAKKKRAKIRARLDKTIKRYKRR